MNIEPQNEILMPQEGSNTDHNPPTGPDNGVKQSPLSNSTDSTDILTRKEGLEAIPNGQNIKEENLMTDSQYIEQYESDNLLYKGFKGNIHDLKLFLISKIGALVELIQKYYESKSLIHNFRWRFDQKKFIDRIEGCGNKQKYKPMLTSYFECQVDTVKALYSDEEDLLELLEEFTKKFKEDFLQNCSQDVVQELVINKSNSKRKASKPESYVNMTNPKSVSIEPTKKRAKSSNKPKESKKEVKIEEPEILEEPTDPNARAKRKIKKISYCEDEKLEKRNKKKQKSTPKQSNSSKKTNPSKPTKPRQGIELNMEHIIAYTWKESNKEFSNLLSTLSELEFKWFIERVRLEHPECISFEEEGLQLKLGHEQIKDESDLDQERRKNLMKDEILFLNTFSKYIYDLKRDPTDGIESSGLDEEEKL